MSKIWPKVILDPVHNIIAFEDNKCDRLLLDLIDTPEFQRLRRIRQLGMSNLVFPGANHTRFTHSIGVMHFARKFLEKVCRQLKKPLDEFLKTATLTAALLHDIGHGPFSHAFENITNQKHEDWAVKVILDEDTTVHKLMNEYSTELPATVAMFFIETSGGDRNQIPTYLREIIESQLDADRFDYLLRDCHATGTIYGQFDYTWLLQHIRVNEDKQVLYLSRKAISAAETYVFARYHMYRSVYYHKTTRAAEVMLKLIFDRYKKMLSDAGSLAKAKKVVPGCPKVVVSAFMGDMKLDDFLYLDDISITEFLKACMHARDNILNELGHGLINRKLFKCTDLTDVEINKQIEFQKEIERNLRDTGREPDYYCKVDSPGQVAYVPYDPNADEPASQINIENVAGKVVELSTVSTPVAQLKTKYQFARFYYPKEIRDNVNMIAGG